MSLVHFLKLQVKFDDVFGTPTETPLKLQVKFDDVMSTPIETPSHVR